MLRGESARVAARVRELVGGAEPEPAAVAPELPSALPAALPSALPSVRAGERPAWWRQVAAMMPVRLDPGRRGALAMGAAVLVAALLTGVWLMGSRPRPVALSAHVQQPAAASGIGGGTHPLTPSSAAVAGAAPAEATPPASAAASAGQVVIDVAGKVRRPGLYTLPAGSRIDDALTAAGGARRGVDLSSLNLAAPLADGQQILVGARGATSAVSGGAVAGAPDPSAAAAGTTAPVSLNTATLEQLETLPRVGPVTAQKILDYRSAHGSFSSVDQLKDIAGIGDVTFAGLAPLVTL